MGSAEHERIMGSGGRAPCGHQWQNLWSGEGKAPPEAESFLRIGHSKEGANGLMSVFFK